MLVGIYVVVSAAAQAVHGTAFLASDENIDDVLSALGGRRDGLAVGQAADHRGADVGRGVDADHHPADHADGAVDGRQGAIPSYWARVHPKYLTPSTSTIWMGILSIAWYVGLKIVSENVLGDAIAGLGLAIAFYYGMTGIACPVFYRHHLQGREEHLHAGGGAAAWARRC